MAIGNFSWNFVKSKVVNLFPIFFIPLKTTLEISKIM